MSFNQPSIVEEAVSFTPRELGRLQFAKYQAYKLESISPPFDLDFHFDLDPDWVEFREWMERPESPYQKQQEFQQNLVVDPGAYHYHEQGGHMNKCYAQHP